MCGICTCKHVDMNTSCFLCLQSGGGGATSSSRDQCVGGEHLWHGKGGGTRWPPSQLAGEVEIVSKTCVYFGNEEVC